MRDCTAHTYIISERTLGRTSAHRGVVVFEGHGFVLAWWD